MDELNANVKDYLLQRIAYCIENEIEFSGAHEILDDETGEYVYVEWELKINA